MKKIVLFLLAVVFCLGVLTACNEKSRANAPASDNKNNADNDSIDNSDDEVSEEGR